MTLQGVINKTGILLLLCLGSAAFAWTQPVLRGPLLIIGLFGGFIACLVGTFRPTASPIAAPIYAVLEGFASEPFPRSSRCGFPESCSMRCC